jgi:hypothetical protein
MMARYRVIEADVFLGTQDLLDGGVGNRGLTDRNQCTGYVDGIDMTPGYVDETTFHRHIGERPRTLPGRPPPVVLQGVLG